MPADAWVAPRAGPRMSMTRTRAPREESSWATAHPMMPAPTTVTFTHWILVSRPADSLRLSLHGVSSRSHTARLRSPVVPRMQSPVDLVLYVSATSTYSATAIRNCQTLLKRFDAGHVHFEVCDIRKHPERADEDSVCYTPVLVKRRPLP